MIPDIHKTVIVTGASQGVGADLVKAFLDRRYNVVATFVAPLTLEDLPESFHPTLKAVRSSAFSP